MLCRLTRGRWDVQVEVEAIPPKACFSTGFSYTLSEPFSSSVSRLGAEFQANRQSRQDGESLSRQIRQQCW